MKKIISLLLVLVMLLGLAACGAKPEAAPETQPATEAATEPATEAATEAPTEETAEPALVVDTGILMEADADMLNTYTVIAVDPAAPFADADGNPVTDADETTRLNAGLLDNSVMPILGTDTHA